MKAHEAATITGRKDPVGRPPSDDAAGPTPVVAATWCRSVGTTWTLELHELDADTARGTVVAWISSGVPVTQPAPDALARDLLAARGLRLLRDPSAGPGTRSRRRIGYVCADTEPITGTADHQVPRQRQTTENQRMWAEHTIR